MNITQYKINNYAEGVSDLPDYPSDEGYTAKQLKAIFDSRSDNEIKEKHNALIEDLSEILTEQQESIDKLKGAKVVSVHDDLSATVPTDGEVYIVKYHDMPYGENPELISDAVFYRIKIGDGVRTLAELPVISNIQVGDGVGSIVQIDPTYNGGIDDIKSASSATGKNSCALGNYTKATGKNAVAINYGTKASGEYSLAAGNQTEASAFASVALGERTKATEDYTIAFGKDCEATQKRSVAGGYGSISQHFQSFVYGLRLLSSRSQQIVFGQYNAPSSSGILVIGNGVDEENRANTFTINYDNSFTLGNTKITEEELKKMKTWTAGTAPVVSVHDDLAAVIPKEGEQYVIKYHDMPYGENPELISDAVFYRIKIGDGVHTLADLPVMSNIEAGTGNGSIRLVDPTYDNGEDGIEAPNTVASGQYSVSLGKYTVASGKASAAFNYSSEATGDRSFACNNGMSEGKVSFSANEGHAIGSHSAAFGTSTANGDQSFASGGTNQANGKYSHAGGYSSKALGNGSFAHGKNSVAEGEYSFAIGTNNTAGASNSFVSGAYNSANNGSQAVVGFYNVPVQEDMFMVGAGKAYISKDAEGNTVRDERRANAFEVNRRGIIKVNRTPYGEEAGTEPSLQLGDTVLSETSLSDMLTYGEKIKELEDTISALTLRLDAYIIGGGEATGDTSGTVFATKEYVDNSIQSAILDSWEAEV